MAHPTRFVPTPHYVQENKQRAQLTYLFRTFKIHDVHHNRRRRLPRSVQQQRGATGAL